MLTARAPRRLDVIDDAWVKRFLPDRGVATLDAGGPLRLTGGWVCRMVIPRFSAHIRSLPKTAKTPRRFGYSRLHLILRRDGHVLDQAQTRRLSHEEGLSRHRSHSRKHALVSQAPPGRAALANARRSVALVKDQIAHGRHLRIPTGSAMSRRKASYSVFAQQITAYRRAAMMSARPLITEVPRPQRSAATARGSVWRRALFFLLAMTRTTGRLTEWSTRESVISCAGSLIP